VRASNSRSPSANPLPPRACRQAVLIAILADTHLPRGQRRLPDRCVSLLSEADLILHAGDLSTLGALEQLSAFSAPLHAVHGNVDEPALVKRLPGELQLELEG